MTLYELATLILTLAVLLGYLNHRFIKMQATIAVMVGSMLLSVLIILASNFGIGIKETISNALISLDFSDLLMHGMLSFLLFAGSLNIDLGSLKHHRYEIGILSCISTIISALLISVATYYLLNYCGIHLLFTECFIFGALISPTDPIAVLNTFKELGAPKQLGTIVSGESLFNDGVGIVLFTSIVGIIYHGGELSFANVSYSFATLALGGIIYGSILGKIAAILIRSAGEYKMAALITLVIVTGGYTFAEYIDVSGPLAMVIAGIIVGNSGRANEKQINIQHHLDSFWEIIDEVLNAILFMLIGFEVLIIPTYFNIILLSVMAVPVVLIARWIVVTVPMSLFKLKRKYSPYATSILVWGGLRGGLAVALALSLPEGGTRDIILTMTYTVVAFSIIFQGLTTPILVHKSKEKALKNGAKTISTADLKN